MKIIKKIFGKIFYIEQRMITDIRRKRECAGYVLMFHCISDNSKKWYDKEYSISLKGMMNLVFKLKKNGYSIKPINDIFNSSGNDVFITFDDGFEGIYSEFYTFAVKNSIPFTIFIVIDFLDKPGYLTTEQLLELSKCSLCTIGAHTITHPKLRGISRKEIINEVQNGKEKLQDIIGRKVNYFAYPYGNVAACNRICKQIVKRVGFAGAFSTIQTHISTRELLKKYYISRININETNYKDFLSKLNSL